MLKQFNAPDGDSCKEVSYEYDALNFRTKRTSILEETVTEYAYGRNGALTYEKFTKNGTTAGSRTYAYLNDQIIEFTDTDGTVESKRYAVTDIQGSVNEIYDESGNLIWKSGYTAFGKLAGESVDKLEGVFEFHGMYTGCQIDAETGLTYHWNRWRSEDGSSFITQDPARDGSNWYGYCGQNPVTRYDPSGLNWMDREGNWHSNSETGINYNVGDKTPSGPQGETGPSETPKEPEPRREPDTTVSTKVNDTVPKKGRASKKVDGRKINGVYTIFIVCKKTGKMYVYQSRKKNGSDVQCVAVFDVITSVARNGDSNIETDTSRIDKSDNTHPTQVEDGIYEINEARAPYTGEGDYGTGKQGLVVNTTQILESETLDENGNKTSVESSGYMIHITPFNYTNGCVGFKYEKGNAVSKQEAVNKMMYCVSLYESTKAQGGKVYVQYK